MQHLNTGALALYHGKAAVITAINKDKIDIRIEVPQLDLPPLDLGPPPK